MIIRKLNLKESAITSTKQKINHLIKISTTDSETCKTSGDNDM